MRQKTEKMRNCERVVGDERVIKRKPKNKLMKNKKRIKQMLKE